MARQLIIDRFEGLYAICEELPQEGKKETGKNPPKTERICISSVSKKLSFRKMHAREASL